MGRIHLEPPDRLHQAQPRLPALQRLRSHPARAETFLVRPRRVHPTDPLMRDPPLSDVVPTETHLIVPPGASRRHQGLRLHTNRLQADDITAYAGLPVTTVSRTLAHVTAAGLADALIIQAAHEAIQRGLATKKRLLDMANQQGGRLQRLVHTALEEAVSRTG